MDDDADVAVDPNRPEDIVSGAIEFMKLQTGLGNIQLQIERGGFRRFLMLHRQAHQAVLKGVGDSEFHN
jgi:hypothetical protein